MSKNIAVISTFGTQLLMGLRWLYRARYYWYSILGIRVNEDGVPEDEENFDEAIKAVNTALHNLSAVSASLRDILDHPQTCDITSEVIIYFHSMYISSYNYLTVNVNIKIHSQRLFW